MGEAAGVAFARFMELRGHRVLEKCGVLWHSVGHAMYVSLPYHLSLDLDPGEANKVVCSAGAVGFRYPSLVWEGLPSGLYVCRRRDYGICALHRSFRNHVRKGVECCEVRRLTSDELTTQAFAVNLETMQRQHRFDAEFGDAGRWRRFVRAIAACPCVTAIGAFVDTRLASYAITCFEGGWLHILHKMTSFRFDAQHPSHVLDYTITQQIARDPSVEAVCMGWAPLVPHQGLHDYKLRLGYTFEPQFSVICLHPALRWILCCRSSIAAIGVAKRLRGESQTLDVATAVLEGARTSGMARHSPASAAEICMRAAGGAPAAPPGRRLT